MLLPRFEITNQILRNIGGIEAGREIIENAPLIPAYEKKFKGEVIARTVYHATRLDGNDLSLLETQKLVEGGKITAGERDIQEVLNYRNVLRYLDEVALGAEKDTAFVFRESHLLKIHSLVVEKIIPKNEAGVYRTAQVVLKNSLTNEIIFRPPPAIEIPYYVDEFLEWLNKTKAEEIHPVLAAGVGLYLLYSIHPFIEGNGRTARGFANLVLAVRGYDARKLLSLEEYFDNHNEEYYQALMKVDQTHPQIFQRDLTGWLEFFSLALAAEISRAKEAVKSLSSDGKLKELLGGKQVSLSERQLKLMDYIAEFGLIKMQDAKGILPMVSEDTLLRDLMDLIKKGILKKKGKTKKAIYLLRNRKDKG